MVTDKLDLTCLHSCLTAEQLICIVPYLVHRCMCVGEYAITPNIVEVKWKPESSERKLVRQRIYHTTHSMTKSNCTQSTGKENRSPNSKRRLNHRVFTDSTEKQAVEQYEITYDNTNKPRDGNDLAALLIMIQNQKNPSSVVINVSCSTLARIKQQYDMSTNHTVAAMCT